MKGKDVTVETSEYGIIPEGTTFTVRNDQTNRFTDRRVLTLEQSADVDIPNRLGSFQVYTTPEKERWTEIHSGLAREHEVLTFE